MIASPEQHDRRERRQEKRDGKPPRGRFVAAMSLTIIDYI